MHRNSARGSPAPAPCRVRVAARAWRWRWRAAAQRAGNAQRADEQRWIRASLACTVGARQRRGREERRGEHRHSLEQQRSASGSRSASNCASLSTALPRIALWIYPPCVSPACPAYPASPASPGCSRRRCAGRACRESACACPPTIHPATSGLAWLGAVRSKTVHCDLHAAAPTSTTPIAPLCIAQPVFSSTPPVAKL